MHRKLPLVLPLICAGCLERDISRHIDEIGECTETTTGTSTGPGTDTSTDTTTTTTSTGDTSTSTGDTSTSTSETSETSTSDTSTTDTSSTTDEPVAECGNGVVEDFGPTPEECDDANQNPDDGCNNDCARDRIVFVTSELYKGGIFGGLDGADQRCRSLAAQAGLPNFAGYKAWLSDSQTSAAERMFHSRGRYVLVNGLVVAESWEALVAGELQNPINATETSGAKDYVAWTGTNPDGSAIAGADHCGDWAANNLANKGFWGNTKEVTAEWTLAVADVGQPQGCAGNLALYCFEQE